ncbi:hypothetical protein DSO57_1036348 [Entomophthora muscae]|uniref:Uncharacterized protein n=2 Tax=Entomophthora muscae TaxID=34485 RepID=A0ACC2TYP9_9FUNG|nr:hypothetical protein DSO57_1036348 [Entomophthora muscae]
MPLDYQASSPSGEGSLFTDLQTPTPLPPVFNHDPAAHSVNFVPKASQASMEILNKELQKAGCSALDFSSTELFFESVFKTMISFLGQHHSTQSFRDNYEERLRRVTFDYDSVLAHSERLKARLEKSYRETDASKSQLKSISSELKTTKDLLSKASRELKQIQTNHARCKSQFAHSLRLQEAEVAKLKERTKTIINEKYKTAKLGIVGLNTFRTAQISFEKDTEEYYTDLIRGYSARESNLVEEKEALQQLLINLAEKVAPIVGAPNSKLKEAFDPLKNTFIETLGDRLVSSWEAHSLAKPQMHNMGTQTMPIQYSRPVSRESRVVDQLEHQEQQVLDLLHGVEALGSQINGCRQIMTEQDVLLQKAAHTPHSEADANSSFADLNLQRYVLEKERAEIEEATQRMRRERILLESERSFQMTPPQLASGYGSLSNTPTTAQASPRGNILPDSPFPKRARIHEPNTRNPNFRASITPRLRNNVLHTEDPFWNEPESLSDAWKEI